MYRIIIMRRRGCHRMQLESNKWSYLGMKCNKIRSTLPIRSKDLLECLSWICSLGRSTTINLNSWLIQLPPSSRACILLITSTTSICLKRSSSNFMRNLIMIYTTKSIEFRCSWTRQRMKETTFLISFRKCVSRSLRNRCHLKSKRMIAKMIKISPNPRSCNLDPWWLV